MTTVIACYAEAEYLTRNRRQHIERSGDDGHRDVAAVLVFSIAKVGRNRVTGHTAMLTGGAKSNEWPDIEGAVFDIRSQRHFLPIFGALVERGVPYEAIKAPDPPERTVRIGRRTYHMVEEFLTVPRNHLSPAVASRNLHDFVNTLSRHGIEHFLLFGTLLGAVREGEFIRHDYDTDIGVFARDRRKLLGLVFELESHGLRMVRCQPELLSFMRDGDYIDVYPFRRSLFRRHWLFQGHKFDRSALRHLSRVTLAGESYAAPGRPEDLLERMYGKDWRVPMPGHHAARPATVRNRVRSLLSQCVPTPVKRILKRLRI